MDEQPAAASIDASPPEPPATPTATPSTSDPVEGAILAAAPATALPVEAAAPADSAADVDPEPPEGAGPQAGEAPADPAAGVAVLERPRRSRRTLVRFLLAFAFGMLAVMAISAGALAAYTSGSQGRILAGVHAGSVDLSGLTPDQAATKLRAAYGSIGSGQLVLTAGTSTRTVSYADLGRRIDVDAIVADAMAVGRDGPAIERLAANVRTFLRGADVAPRATFEAAALRYEIDRLAATVDHPAVDAAVVADAGGFTVSPSAAGSATDVDRAVAAAEILIADPNAPPTVTLELPVMVVNPSVTTDQAASAKDAALRISNDIILVDGSQSWTIPGTTIRGWITFGPTASSSYAPIVSPDGLAGGVTAIAGKVDVAPVDATFLLDPAKQVVGVAAAKPGRSLDVPGTVASISSLVAQRAAGIMGARIPISITTVQPAFTTDQATKTAPLMQPISSWTTWFPYGIRNNNGANIWIPARDINGQVVMPGQWFDFWKRIGPVTRARGYGDGGAIINGHTEPTGALAGGICSCSTTLFNAAVRAGLQMGARENHYYYIDRYPLGLDATVWQSSSGSVQTMSFRNDTAYPILIRGSGWRVGAKGYVRFVLWSVPTGRTVTFTTPIVKNIRPATDTIVYTTSLAPGVEKRVEYPVDGKDVWVTRIVKDASGKIIHEETYYSHYSRVTGVLEIGIKPS